MEKQQEQNFDQYEVNNLRATIVRLEKAFEGVMTQLTILQKDKSGSCLFAERAEFERRAVEAETQLRKAQDDAALREKAFQEMEKQLHELKKDNGHLKTTVGNLQGQQGVLEENGNKFNAEWAEFERRAVEAEAQLEKAQDHAVQMKKAYQQMEKQLNDLKKENGDLKNLKIQRGTLEENANEFETSRTNDALVSELRRKLQNEVMYRASLSSFYFDREKAFMEQQVSLEHEKEQLVKSVDQLFQEKTEIVAMFEEEREKTSRLEKEADESLLKGGKMTQKLRDELKRRDQEKKKMEQQLKRSQQREDQALQQISELTKTKERLEKELVENSDTYKLDYIEWREVKGRLVQHIEYLIEENKSKQERKGFFSRVFRMKRRDS